jgi:hypothetical protein
MLTVNYRKSQKKMEMRRKIEMRNMLIEKERKKGRNEYDKIRLLQREIM